MKNVLVIAWCENTGLRDTGRVELRDANWFPVMEVVPKGCACVWSRDLSANMRRRGEDYARRMSRTDPDKFNIQFVEMPDTKDVLSRARELVIGKVATHA